MSIWQRLIRFIKKPEPIPVYSEEQCREIAYLHMQQMVGLAVGRGGAVGARARRIAASLDGEQTELSGLPGPPITENGESGRG